MPRTLGRGWYGRSFHRRQWPTGDRPPLQVHREFDTSALQAPACGAARQLGVRFDAFASPPGTPCCRRPSLVLRSGLPVPGPRCPFALLVLIPALSRPPAGPLGGWVCPSSRALPSRSRPWSRAWPPRLSLVFGVPGACLSPLSQDHFVRSSRKGLTWTALA
jgi:hypothetical protein